MATTFSPPNKLFPASTSQRNAITKAKALVAKGELYRASASKSAITATPKKKIDQQEQLKNKVCRFTKHNDRSMLLHTLESSKVLKQIMLEGMVGPFASNERSWLELEEEVTQTKIILNSVPLGGSSDLKKKEMFFVLEKLCDTLASDTDMTTEQVFQAAILRLAHSLAATDAFSQLNALLGSPDLMLLPSNGGLLAPSKLDIYSCAGNVHLMCETTHSYGLFRKVDLSTRARVPWISLFLTVHERINLQNKSGIRYCTVNVAEKLGFV
jgi:hypothetical protein